MKFLAWWTYGCAALLIVLGIGWLQLLGRLGFAQAAASVVGAAMLFPAARALQIYPDRAWWSLPAIAIGELFAALASVTSVEALADGADVVVATVFIGSTVLLVGVGASVVRMVKSPEA